MMYLAPLCTTSNQRFKQCFGRVQLSSKRCESASEANADRASETGGGTNGLVHKPALRSDHEPSLMAISRGKEKHPSLSATPGIVPRFANSEFVKDQMVKSRFGPYR